jgi:hypothetical protein
MHSNVFGHSAHSATKMMMGSSLPDRPMTSLGQVTAAPATRRLESVLTFELNKVFNRVCTELERTRIERTRIR